MSAPRLHVDCALAANSAAALTAEQGHYLRNVLRLGEGAPVIAFNARDGEFAATIEILSKKGGALRLGERRRPPETPPDLWLVIAAVKRAALETIVQKATELGVAAILPVATERTNTARLKIGRLAAIAVEAAEQCGRLSVPRIEEMQALEALLDAWPASRRLLFCDESGDDPDVEWGGAQGRAAPALETLQGAAEGPWAVLIGPEGGFSPAERARLRGSDHVTAATLGPRILRADTAALAALVLWQAVLGDFRRA